MTYALVYLCGVIIGLMVMRDPWAVRLGTALAWPLGPLAFGVVSLILLLSAVMLWPVQMVGAAVIVSVLVWLVL